MTRMEKIPLLPPKTSKSSYGYNGDGYLLLSMPSRGVSVSIESKSLIHKFNCNGNYVGITVAVTGILVIVIFILGIAHHVDISEFARVSADSHSESGLFKATSILKQSSSVGMELSLPLGRLRGYMRNSRKGRKFLAFYKVPYAKSPLKDLRFKDPQPAEKWDEVRDYSDVAPQCVQKSKYSSDEVVGDEDCLYMNIYTPNVSDIANGESLLYPTMLYIHGGDFADGNASRYGAEYFMDENIVLVIIHFRLGLLGLLNTGDRESTGNMMFKDQVMALKWTKDYISYFGGDPNCVTIFGNSAGGMTVSFLMISPMSNGLFHRAISESGTMLAEASAILDLHPDATMKAAAETFNCSLESSTEFLSCLRTKDAKDIALFKTSGTKYGLTIEKGFDPNDLSNVFMPDKPYKLLKSGNMTRVPYIIGINSGEGITKALAILKSVEATEAINANFSGILPNLIDMDLTFEENALIKTFYFGDNDISNETERNLTNLLTDRIVVHPSKVSADFHAKISDTYLYYLSKRPKKSYSDKALKGFPSKPYAVAHADELQFLFPYSGFPEYSPADKDYFPFSEYLVGLWASFAKSGNPGLIGNEGQWLTMNTEQNSIFWFELNDITGPTNVLHERMKFWDQFSHKKLKYDL